MKYRAGPLCAAFVLLSCGVAQAEDARWGGLYLSGHFTAGSASFGGDFFRAATGSSERSELTSVNGMSWGAALGHNFQFGNYVLGFEGKWSGTSVSDTENISFGNFRQEREFQDTIQFGPRFGYAWNRLHAYGTVGLASSGYRVATIEVGGGGAVTQLNDQEDRLYGYYAGVGAEYLLTESLFLGLEYNRTVMVGTDSRWFDTGGLLNVLEADNPVVDKVVFRAGVKF